MSDREKKAVAISGPPAIARRYHKSERDIVPSKPRRPNIRKGLEPISEERISGVQPVEDPHLERDITAQKSANMEIAKAALETAESREPVGKGGVFVRLNEEQLAALDRYRGSTSRAVMARAIIIGEILLKPVEIKSISPKKVKVKRNKV